MTEDPRRQIAGGKVAPDREASVSVPLTDLCRGAGGARDRQLLWGDRVEVFADAGGWSYVRAVKDGYVGHLRSDHLSAVIAPTHWVSVAAGHAYHEPSIKAPEAHPLYFGAQVQIVAHTGAFFETAQGSFIPRPQLLGRDRRFSDPATVAQLFFGAPYLWGGNTVAGLDCSGLVQAAHLACDIACPGDSDQQEAALGQDLPLDAPVQRGDLYFWQGHVAMAMDADMLIHANAHHMAVAYEPIEEAISRIESQGDGAVRSRRRVTPPRG